MGSIWQIDCLPGPARIASIGKILDSLDSPMVDDYDLSSILFSKVPHCIRKGLAGAQVEEALQLDW